MANWWDDAPVVSSGTAAPESGNDWWSAAPVVEDKSYTGTILPISYDKEGSVSFDSNAGILGSLKRTLMLPGDVMAGKVDPMSEEGLGRALEFAATVSPSTPGLRSGDKIVPGVAQSLQKTIPPVPSQEALKLAAKQGYDDAAGLGVEFSTGSVQSLASQIAAKLDSEGLIGKVAPKTRSIIDELTAPPAEAVSVPLSGFEAARKAFGRVGQDFNNPPDQLASKIARDAVDKFSRQAPDGAVLAGDATQASLLQRTADGNYAAFKRSGLLDDLENAATVRAEAANSGQNTANNIRQRIASLILNPKQSGKFTDEEILKLRGVSGGTKTSNMARLLSNVMGGGGGLGSVVSGGVAGTAAGAASGAPLAGVAVGAGVPAVGMGLRSVSEYLTRKALSQADEMTRARSPLYRTMQDEAPMEAVRQARTEALIRALLSSGQAPRQLDENET